MLAKILPSYAFSQYADDDDIQAFISAYNNLAQQYLDFILQLNLPIYTGDQIYGLLLDWVARGLYGLTRPTLISAAQPLIGPLNTFRFNQLGFNVFKISPSIYYATSDDIFKRIITWCFYKGDGTQFNIRWLKRRIQRFLTGIDGTDPGINQTYNISVRFGGGVVSINLGRGYIDVLGGALCNRFALNTVSFNRLKTKVIPSYSSPLAPIFKQAVLAGALPLPLQYTYLVYV